MKDDSGSCAVFTEQGSSASQITAVKLKDVRSRLPGCAGQTAYSICAYTQVRMEDAPPLFKIPMSECPDIWIRLPKHKWPESCPVWKIQSFLLNEICTVIVQQDYYGKGNLRKFFQNTDVKKFQIGNAYSLTWRKDYSYLCMWTIQNWLERNETLTRCGKYSCKKLIWENQHHSLTMYAWCVLNENVKQVRILLTITEICSNPGFLPELWKNYQFSRNRMRIFSHGLMTWKVKEMRGKILRTGEENDATIFQSRDAIYG